MATEQHRVVIGVDYLGSQDVNRFIADLNKLGPAAEQQMRRLAEAFRNGQGQLNLNASRQAPLALPAGGGSPRVDASRQRATELAQDQFLRSLRDRIAAENAAAQAAREYARSRRFEDKVAGIASDRGASLSFGPGGNPELAFTAGTARASAQQLQELTTRAARLNQMVDAVNIQFANLSRTMLQQANARAAETNRETLRTLAYRATGGQQTVGGDLQAELLGNILAAVQPTNAAGKALLYQGKATKQFIGQLSAEQRQMLLGSSEPASKYDGPVPIRGLISATERRDDLRNGTLDSAADMMKMEAHGGLFDRQAEVARELEKVAAALRPIALPPSQRLEQQARLAEQGALHPALGRGPAYAAIQAQAQQMRAQLDETARAFLGDRTVLYHGTQGSLPSRLLPRGQETVMNAQAFGPAFYASTDRRYSEGYAYAGPHQRGSLYEIPVPSGKMFDLEQEITARAAAKIANLTRRLGNPNTADQILDRYGRGGTVEEQPPLPSFLRRKGDTGEPRQIVIPKMAWSDLFDFGPQTKALVNQHLADQGFMATRYGSQAMFLHPEQLQPRLLGYVGGDEPLNRTFTPADRSLVPHPVLYGRGQFSMPEYERALSAVRDRSQIVPHGTLYGTGSQTPLLDQILRRHQAALEADTAATRARTAANGGGAGAGGGGGRGGGGGGRNPFAQPGPDDFEAGFRGQNAGSADKLLAAQAGLARAEIVLAEVVRKMAVAYGSKKGYADVEAAEKAYAAALKAREGAAAALVRQETFRRPSATDTGMLYGPQTLAQQQFNASRGAAFSGFQGPLMPLGAQTLQQANAALQQGGQFTPVQAAAQANAKAQQNLAAVTKQHQQVMSGQYTNQQAAAQAYAASMGNLSRAQQQAYATQRALTSAQLNASPMGGRGGGGAYGGGGGGVGGFFGAFGQGFRGNPDVPVAAQLGQTARFSVFYGTMYKVLFAVTQTFQQALAEGIQFEDAMTNLVIAAGKPREELEDLAKTLGGQAVRAGFAPSQGLEIGARSLGLYGAASAPIDVQKEVATISARVVSQVAVGAKKTPVELQGDIAAISQALGLGAGGQQRIADLDAFFTKRFGVQQGSTFETVAQSASVGKAAGFSDEQIFAIAADMISRTGQTPSAVAGFMAQIFSRGGEGSLVDVAAKQGIDPTQKLSEIVGQLAGIYRSADPQTQAQISAAFGRGKVQNAAVALLSDYSEVQSASAAGTTQASGAANKQFEQHMANIGGQIRELGGMLRLFAQELGTSGLLDAIGAGIIVLKDLVQAGNVLLSLWNEMPRGMRDVILAMGLLAVATRTSAGANFLTSAAVAGGLTRAAGPVAAGARLAPLVTASGEAATGFAAAGAVGKGLLRMLGPIALAVGGLLAIGSMKSSIDRAKAAQDAATTVLEQGGALDPATATSSDYRAQAAEVKATATQNRDAVSFFASVASFGTANNNNIDTARRLEAEAKRLENVAAGIPETLAPVLGSFKSLAAGDVKTGLDSLQASGATANQQLTALRDVLYGTAGAAKAAAEAFDAKDFAGRAASGLGAAALGALGDQQVGTRYISGGRAGGASAPVLASSFKSPLSKFLSPQEIEDRLQKALGDNNVDSLGDIDQGTATNVAAQIAEGLSENVFKGIDPAKAKELRDRVFRALRKKLLEDAAGVKAALSGTAALSGEDATAFAQNIIQQSDANLEGLGESDNRGRISELRSRLKDLRTLRTRTTDPLAQAGITENIGKARTQLVESQLAELEAIRKVAYQNAATKAQVNTAGASALQSEINAIVRNGSADQLVALIGAAGKSSIALAKKAILDAIKIARASLVIGAEAAQLGNFINGQMKGMGAAFRGRGAEDANKGANREINRLQKMLAALSGSTFGGGKNNKFGFQGMDVYNPNFPDGPGADAGADKPTAGEIAAERATAYATRSEGQVAAARAAVQTARAQLNKAKKGTLEYYQALGSLFSAQNSLTDAIQAAQKNRMLLSIDMTNPLKMAQVESRAAAIKLRQDIRQGKAGDVISQDRVDLRSARSNAEATRFSQRLQSVQTADQLGRISHTKYLNYLDNERKRLESIKNRTFQQQSQLDQIDGLLKEATKSMQGQFNFGDIKLPTPYEVRRYVESTAGAAIHRSAGPTSATGSHSTYLTLNVNGADTAKVTQIVQSVVGQSARTRTTAPRRQ